MAFSTSSPCKVLSLLLLFLSMVPKNAAFFTSPTPSRFRIRSSLQDIQGGDGDLTEKERAGGTKMKMVKHTVLSVAAALMNVPEEVYTTPPMVDPYPPFGDAQISRRQRISTLLSRGWAPTDGFSIPHEEEDFINNLMESNISGQRPSTYGEVTRLGARQLFQCMELQTDMSILRSGSNKFPIADSNLNPDQTYKRSFLDLGCGSGRLVVQAFMELPHVDHFAGVELAPARYQSAINAWEKVAEEATMIRHELSSLNTTCHFVSGDMYTMDISTVTHVYVASLCFSDQMIEKLAQKLVDEGTKLQCVATLKPFPYHLSKRLGGEPTRRYIETTWTRPRDQGCIVYLYHIPQ